jgi:hypothetical protein
MAPIIAVHGISQQTSGSKVIHSEWWPALCSGLELAGYQDETSLVCPFYGHLFRNRITSAKIETDQFQDDIKFQGYEEDEKELLELLLKEAQNSGADKRPRSFQDDNLSMESSDGIPWDIQNLLRELLKFRCFANFAYDNLERFRYDLRQVVLYLNDKVRNDIREIVIKNIQEDTKVVIGHSLGSVVAYEALCHQPRNNVVSFVSIGSPLGINVIFDKLKPSPTNKKGVWPGEVKYWTNLAEKDDVVALVKQLDSRFSDETRKVKDLEVDNDSDAHDARRYLTTFEVGEAVSQGLYS